MTGMLLPSILSLILQLPGDADSLAGGWRKVESLPDREGFAGMFAGACGDSLIAVGGANFPDAKPWQGGRKVWYDRIFALDSPTGKWRIVGKLPQPLGYGVSISTGDSLCLFGGSHERGHVADAYRLRRNAGKFTIDPLPKLPMPLANACGALVGDLVFIAGGQETPDSAVALDRVWTLNLREQSAKWQSIPACPGGGRMLAMAAAVGDEFWLVGGVSLQAGADGKPVRTYRADAWKYTAKSGWQRLADLPTPLAAAPSPLWTESTDVGKRVSIFGGDDGSQVGANPLEHRGFSKRHLRWQPNQQRWQDSGTIPVGRVTVPTAFWRDQFWIVSGEQRPGVRSPEVWCWTPTRK
ncbi:galactose oxidase [Tuwongella immobilis]|uniref:Galactose oxidase n=1 Tax=Tuwongella immobilis TaxID=692036 RepID=A0A6C2YK35_9BACT|nr:galactose oxidase [Tuwongella immobilis]VIP01938.1 kelch repeat-containing protein : Kelch repeat-containing protein OS=Chthoniobacter flavus Ellin428 GN=CfE428DRAFT_3514 PE=4 SV=1: Kelch_3 [Tuwongella immobilis]VTR99902.1 kelch repeat-containing protein : Kelch repeat-containing protein OS=Chthoniobacter flavus Ellin428 GN=CfE428DRAFT_3514 PE=4 SV=1: Kelch_3 [Tuwongella immobilis]